MSRRIMNTEVYPQGTKVYKKSGKPFLSQNLVNTVKDVVPHPYKKKDGVAVSAYTFFEDDSVVETSICYKYER